MSDESSWRRACCHLLREPLLHFLVLGALLFAAYSYLQPGQPAPQVADREIRYSLDELAQLTQVFQAQWRRAPTPEEFDRLLENKVQQEVLYREALAMGLDQGDEIVKRRMAQKVQFLAEDVAAAREPSREELARWFTQHRDMFAQPPRLSFRHMYFSPDIRGVHAKDDAATALNKLANAPEDTPLAATLADPFMFQDYYRDRAPDFLGKEFGPQFATAVAKLAPGAWRGPVESGFGWHLVFVDTVIPGRVPSFEEIEREVKTAWLGEQKTLAWQKAYSKMRAKYQVLLPAAPENTATNTTSSSSPHQTSARTIPATLHNQDTAAASASSLSDETPE